MKYRVKNIKNINISEDGKLQKRNVVSLSQAYASIFHVLNANTTCVVSTKTEVQNKTKFKPIKWNKKYFTSFFFATS